MLQTQDDGRTYTLGKVSELNTVFQAASQEMYQAQQEAGAADADGTHCSPLKDHVLLLVYIDGNQ